MQPIRISCRACIPLMLLLGFIAPSGVVAQEIRYEDDKLTVSDSAWRDYFGRVLAIDGDWAIIGAIGDDDGGSESGSAYVFHYDGAAWIEYEKLLAHDGKASHGFGYAISLAGESAAIGANHWAEKERGIDCGAMYLFRFNGSNWTEEALLSDADCDSDDNYGAAVGVSGSWALAGAWADDNEKGSQAGSAFLYEYINSNWEMSATLMASDGYYMDHFGHDVSVDNNLAVICAIGNDDRGDNTGSAYVFDFGGLGRGAKLLGSDTAAGDMFGLAVDVSSGVIAVGAPYHDGVFGDDGAVYVYRYDGAQWIEEAILVSPAPGYLYSFGQSLALDGDHLVIGEPGADDYGYGSGAAHVFYYDGAQWTHVAKLIASDGGYGMAFGRAVALSGSTALTSGYESAYVYDLDYRLDPRLVINGACPGSMLFTVENATADGRIAYVYAFGEGSVQIPPGYACAGTVLGLNATAAMAGVAFADANGTATLQANAPARACGKVYMQAIDLSTCRTTNVVLVE